MATIHLVPETLRSLYEVHEWRNAAAVLKEADAAEWNEMVDVLARFRLYARDILEPGGGKSPIAKRFDEAFFSYGWEETSFDTTIVVDGSPAESPTHKVDCYKSQVGIEVEWNNKDPFYDRDLNNFRLLFDLRVVDVGVIVTRSTHLQQVFKYLGKGKSYGASTTHMSKLLPRVEGGGGGGCPILAFGITEKLFVDNRGRDA